MEYSMKRLLTVLLVLYMGCAVAAAKSGPSAGCSRGGGSHSHSSHGSSHHGSHHSARHHSSHSSSGGNSHPVYLVRTENNQSEVKFQNCDEHYAITKTTTNVYSDGTRRSFSSSTIYNADGTVFESDCTSVKHTIYNDQHYFIVGKRDGYSIIDNDGKTVTSRNYSFMKELEPNRILVKRDKKYGIIDLRDEVVVPVKYQNFENVNKRIMIAKLNGYYGVVDFDNNTLIYPDCDKIKTLYDTMVLKRYGKYGLANLEGEKILEPHYDKIKKLGEYILVKKDNKYGVLNSDGEFIAEIIYKKIKLERNRLKGIQENSVWKDIKTGSI